MTSPVRPTQSDVARLAGVSQATVSHVLNDTPNMAIPQSTRQRILDAIDELGYVPDRTARSLRTRKTYTIASVIPDITNPFYPAFQRGIQGVTRQNNYDLFAYDTDGELANEQRILDSLMQGQVDGAIVVLFHLGYESLAPLLRRKIPIVALVAGKWESGDLPLDSLYIDNTAAAHKAVSYLIEKGHTRIGMLAGVEETPPRRSRILGYQQALADHGLSLVETLIRGSDFTEEGGREAMRELLKVLPLPTAIFAANDLMGIGAMMAIREAGLSAPEDIAVVGFDDIPAASLVNPSLTTVTQFQHQIGKLAAEMVFERILGSAPEEGRSIEMPFELIVRDSA